MSRKSGTQDKGEEALEKAKGKAKEATGTTNEQYAAAVARCELAARNHGHTLGVWYPVAEQLHISAYVLCDAMVWVARPGHEKCWRVGSTALEQECLDEEDRGPRSWELVEQA